MSFVNTWIDAADKVLSLAPRVPAYFATRRLPAQLVTIAVKGDPAGPPTHVTINNGFDHPITYIEVSCWTIRQDQSLVEHLACASTTTVAGKSSEALRVCLADAFSQGRRSLTVAYLTVFSDLHRQALDPIQQRPA